MDLSPAVGHRGPMRLLNWVEIAFAIAWPAAAASAPSAATAFSPQGDDVEFARGAPGSGDIQWRDRRASVVVESETGPHRTYRFSATSADGRAERSVAEEQGQPYLRTGNILFDGLFAMALADARLDEVAQIRDGSFNGADPLIAHVSRPARNGPTFGRATSPMRSISASAAWIRRGRSIHCCSRHRGFGPRSRTSSCGT